MRHYLLLKAKYVKRTGTPGNYRYFYVRPKPKQGSEVGVPLVEKQAVAASNDYDYIAGRIERALKKQRGGAEAWSDLPLEDTQKVIKYVQQTNRYPKTVADVEAIVATKTTSADPPEKQLGHLLALGEVDSLVDALLQGEDHPQVRPVIDKLKRSGDLKAMHAGSEDRWSSRFNNAWYDDVPDGELFRGTDGNYHVQYKDYDVAGHYILSEKVGKALIRAGWPLVKQGDKKKAAQGGAGGASTEANGPARPDEPVRLFSSPTDPQREAYRKYAATVVGAATGVSSVKVVGDPDGYIDGDMQVVDAEITVDTPTGPRTLELAVTDVSPRTVRRAAKGDEQSMRALMKKLKRDVRQSVEFDSTLR